MFQAIMLVVGVYYLIRLLTLGSAGANSGMPPDVLQQWRGQKRKQYVWGIVAGWGSFGLDLLLLSPGVNPCQHTYDCTRAQALEVSLMVLVFTLPVLLGGVLLSDRARRKAKTLQRGPSAPVGWPQPGWPQAGAQPGAAQFGWPQAVPVSPIPADVVEASKADVGEPSSAQPEESAVADPPVPAQADSPQTDALQPARRAPRRKKPLLAGLAALGLVGIVVAGALVFVVGGSRSDPVIVVPASYAAAFQSGAPDGDYAFYALKDKVPDWKSFAAAGIFICSVTRPALIPQTERAGLDSGAFRSGTLLNLNTSDIADSLGIKQLVVTVPAAVQGCTEVAVKRMADTPGMLMLTDAKASFAEQPQVVKVVLRADGGGAAHASSSATQAAGSGSVGGTGLTSAASDYTSIKSYKFTMTMAGSAFTGLTGMLTPGAGASGHELTISATVVTSPEKAADITMMGIRTIEVGGYSYSDLTSVGGGWFKTPVDGKGLADTFSPEELFAAYAKVNLTAFKLVGSGQKNGVDADHYQGDTSKMAAYGSTYGVAGDAKWSADIWVAKTGGYAVSVNYVAMDSSNKLAFQVSYDITNINDPSLKVTAPPT